MADKKLMDPLVRTRVYPHPEQVFDFAPVSLETALSDCLVAVDTNVLVLPYLTGQQSLKGIRQTYKTLVDQNRLRIPGQVAREFADIRAEKLKTLYQQLSQKRNVTLKVGKYPLLEGIEQYHELLEKEKDLAEIMESYRDQVRELLETVESWKWDDPVSTIYRELFKGPVVVDPKHDEKKLLEELAYRQENKIPPGYKDANNEHSGAGDFLIWMALLKLGESEKKHLLFVSGEEKPDWWYRSENRSLYPRFELVDEYRRASGGHSFLMIGFADLLKHFGATDDVIAEVEEKEPLSAIRGFAEYRDTWNDVPAPYVRPTKDAEEAVYRWLMGSLGISRGEIIRQWDGFPDLVVSHGTIIEGYEIKDLRSVTDYKKMISNSLNVMLNSPVSSGLNLVLVFVVGEQRTMQPVIDLVEEFRTAARPHFMILIGTIDSEGVFVPYHV
ncbi:PIN-like domain-containing protein [Telmatobacter sp. DSM 110680]|uniref:PIN-like domain-containing protein n=1 Tax=Telmatobacter sp. DSM 110680 TaxID=3036704 RepID=A0AAU7DMF5_9BACT